MNLYALLKTAPVVSAETMTRASVLLPVVLAVLLGTFLLVGAGFAQPDVMHNATHDVRHALGFPCH